jgi:riboflavin synthase
MFSGIVQHTSLVTAITHEPGLTHLELDVGVQTEPLKLGASVSVAGVCLTVTAVDGTRVSFDIMGETLAKTSLGSLVPGDRVNTERSVRVGDEIGGHQVSGHITGVATITAIETPRRNWIITLSVDPLWIPYILPKGFIALDGCSLTIVDVGPEWFTVHLIPETHQHCRQRSWRYHPTHFGLRS